MNKPLLIFDGDCGFCRRWIAYWQTLTGDQVDYAPYQEVGSRFSFIPLSKFEEAVQLVLPDGTHTSGADAVLRTLGVRPRLRWLHWSYRHVPGAAWIYERAYRFVAEHRILFSRLTQWVFPEK